MNKILKKNLTFLSRRYPSIEKKIVAINNTYPFSFLSSPVPNIYMKDKPIHSRANPGKEAMNLVRDLTVKEGYVFVFMGIGLGYHIEAFVNLYGKKAAEATIIAIEKSPEAFRLLTDNRDISFLENVHLFIGESIDFIASCFERLNPLSFKGYRIIKLRGAFSSFINYYEELESYFKSSISGKLSDILTRFAFESLWMKNIVENIPFLAGKRSINALKNTLKNKPAMVIGAGPSLLGQLEMIKQISQNLHLIAVDTALEPLLKSGIEPDYIVTLDAQFINLFHFHHVLTGNKHPGGMNLVADIVACPKILKYWRGNLYFSEAVSRIQDNKKTHHESLPLMNLFRNYFQQIDPLECGGSVATTAIELALYMGANPVLVTGIDLSYTNFMTHINSSTLYTLYFLEADRFKNLQTSIINQIRKRKLQMAPGIHGGNVLSDFVFSKYINWIENKKEYRNLVFNVTENGALIPHLRHLSLQKLISDSFFKTKKAVPAVFPVEIFSRDISLMFLQDLKIKVADAREELKNYLKSKEAVNVFINKYPFLKNIMLEITSLYSNYTSSYTNLVMFLSLLERKIERSVKRIEK